MAYTVADIYDEATKIFGACTRQYLYEKLSDAIEVLAFTGELDPLNGVVDICTGGSQIVTLPREVYTPLQINIDGEPGLGRDQLFTFHLNGPGDCRCVDKSKQTGWRDYGLVPTYRWLQEDSKLVAFVEDEDDEGAGLWAYGMDPSNNEIVTKNADGTVTRGYQIPTVFGYALPDADAPIFSRVTRVRKDVTVGTIRLSSFNNDATTGTLLGVFQWDETDPQYRQIKLEKRCAQWIRVFYRKKLFKITGLEDLIPISSRAALKQMLYALKYYEEGDLARATGHEATARRFLTESTLAQEPPGMMPIQVMETNNPYDYEDGLN